MNKIGKYSIIDKSVEIGNNVVIGNHVTLYKNVRIADNVHIWDNCVIGRVPMGVQSNKRIISSLEWTNIKNGSVIGCNVIVYSGTVIGRNNIIGDNTVIRENVNFEEDVVIGFNTSIQYNVKIGQGSRVLQQSAVSSFTQIGRNNFISFGFACVSDKNFGQDGYIPEKIFGPTLGDSNNIGPHVTIVSNITIGDNNLIGAHSLITKSIKDNAVYYGVPAKLIRTK